MKTLLASILFVAGCWAQNTPAVNIPAGQIVPMWIKCTVTNSTTNLVVSGTG